MLENFYSRIISYNSNNQIISQKLIIISNSYNLTIDTKLIIKRITLLVVKYYLDEFVYQIYLVFLLWCIRQKIDIRCDNLRASYYAKELGRTFFLLIRVIIHSSFGLLLPLYFVLFSLFSKLNTTIFLLLRFDSGFKYIKDRDKEFIVIIKSYNKSIYDFLLLCCCPFTDINKNLPIRSYDQLTNKNNKMSIPNILEHVSYPVVNSLEYYELF